MRSIIQRVSEAQVSIGGKVRANIGKGLLVLAAWEEVDELQDVAWMSSKICQMRIFGDSQGLMNLSVKDVEGQILVVSQFTLYAATRKGNRPSFVRSAKPETAIPLYQSFVRELGQQLEQPIATGEFGANMKIALVNDGPVTISVDSRARE